MLVGINELVSFSNYLLFVFKWGKTFKQRKTMTILSHFYYIAWAIN